MRIKLSISLEKQTTLKPYIPDGKCQKNPDACEANLGHFSTKIDLLNRDHGKNGIQDLMNNKYISRF